MLSTNKTPLKKNMGKGEGKRRCTVISIKESGIYFLKITVKFIRQQHIRYTVRQYKQFYGS